MTGSTVPDGFTYETNADIPAVTLRAEAGETLAEQVQEKFVSTDSSIGDLDSRVGTIESQGAPSWVRIQQGTVADVSTFVINGIPTGVYSRVRLSLFGNATLALPIRIRFNDDNTASMHQSSLLVRDAEGTLIVDQYKTDTFWEIGQWGTGNGCASTTEIFGTDITENCAFMTDSHRIGGSATGQTYSHGWGRLNNARLLDSLRVSGPSGGTMSCRWWLEGAPA